MSQSLHLPSNPTSPIPKPTRLLPRSPSEPLHLSRSDNPNTNQNGPNNQPIYVLTADGSSLFLLDPSKPRGGEEPPPYASFPISPQQSNREEGGVIRQSPNTNTAEHHEHHHRDRARTLSSLNTTGHPHRPRYTTSQSFNRPNAPGGSIAVSRSRSAFSSPRVHTALPLNDETTPLLPHQQVGVATEDGRNPRGLWRSIWCGDLDVEIDEQPGGWWKGFKRFWRPLGRKEYWRAGVHLVLLNFPLALLVWPFLVAGTLAGTVLLITLPLGAAVWWLTLFISRSAARLESIMQLHYHSPLSPASPPSNHPIFYRLVPSISPTTPISSPTSPYPQTPGLDASDEETPNPISEETTALVWEKRFMKCSYAMFLDHYSYSALSYFLLIKPLITLFSTIVIIVLLPIAVGTIIGLPVYLRVLRRWGKWQAEVAIENL
ncbi:hypothetical protein I302_108639 [Kwoniella bestiolae CBS 10118]|uniref:Uncharacterized protein n=1 Tax=Kwoniella bestiolae CBS 10118 TaxID=1296100 RepID=A0A1B9FTM8_9TREE|nr:hypothetical protein I302_07776 [Kwoniella bestiolae CBS 10118]OCF22134.1 hypothetical protein I302_07776 [Kwoniella bestiolae CBS 10118]